MIRLLKIVALFIWWPFRRGPATCLFIYAHPRSGSSLLMHILADHPQIAGYGEYFTKYRSKLDYMLAEFDIRRKSGYLFKPVRYVVNQVNHQSVTPNFSLVTLKSTCIFLFRQAHPTLSSMLELSDAKGMPMTPDAVANNYSVRLHDMMKQALAFSEDKKFALTYEQLVDSPKEILGALTAFLCLEEPLKSDYKTKGFTGKWGDISQHIGKGVIVQTDSPMRNLDANLLKYCNNDYQQALAHLKPYTAHVQR